MAYYVPGKFIYLATPHTASSSTITVFRRWQREEKLGREIKGHHIRLAEIRKQVQSTPDLPNVSTELVWTVLRNPYDLLVTWWLRRAANRGTDFRTFVRGWKAGPYIVDDMMYFHAPDAARILRFESLEEDLGKLVKDLGLPPIDLPKTNPTPNKNPWPTYYNDEILKIANERFSSEFKPYYGIVTNSSMLPRVANSSILPRIS